MRVAYTQKQFIDEIRFGRHYRVLSFCMTKLNETKKDVLRHLILIQVYLLAVSPSLLATMIEYFNDFALSTTLLVVVTPSLKVTTIRTF